MFFVCIISSVFGDLIPIKEYFGVEKSSFPAAQVIKAHSQLMFCRIPANNLVLTESVCTENFMKFNVVPIQTVSCLSMDDNSSSLGEFQLSAGGCRDGIPHLDRTKEFYVITQKPSNENSWNKSNFAIVTKQVFADTKFRVSMASSKSFSEGMGFGDRMNLFDTAILSSIDGVSVIGQIRNS
jgi:hypothetical protein